jgi:hypothetical protein
MDEQNNHIFIGDIIKHIGRRTSITEWSPEGIVLMVETLKPKFSEGEEILVYSEKHKGFKIIDSDIYSNALIVIGIRQSEKEEE